MRRITLLTVFIIVALPFNSLAFDHSHEAFTIILQAHVHASANELETTVDYAALKKNPAPLNSYLKALSAVTKEAFHTWPKPKQLSFLINAYNAFTIDLILKNYPVKSIKDIGSLGKSPWKIPFVTLLGNSISLDNIEHDMIRKKGIYDEPRIHFAVVCASIGCPALQNRAFSHQRLEEMLENGLVNFVSDKTRNRYNPKKNRFEVSKIFKWYGDDFNQHYGSVTGLLHKYSKHLTVSEKKAKRAVETTKIKYLKYDWNLNATTKRKK